MRRVASAEQITLDAVSASRIDALVVSCGYEARAPQVALKLAGLNADRLCLGFVEQSDDPQRIRNDVTFRGLGFEIENYSGDDYSRVAARVGREVIGDNGFHIAIDVSSMTRAWCWAAIRRVLDMCPGPVTFTFLYSVAEYAPPPKEHAPPRVLGPLPGVSTALEMPDRPISLVMGLGYEPDKALGIMEYVEPFESRVFYTDPAPDVRYVESIKRVNREVLRRVQSENVFTYPYNNLLIAFGTIDSLLRGLVRTSRVIATPMGPKPFALILFLASLGYPSVDVWRVSGNPMGPLSYRQPTGEVLALRVSFEAA